MKIYTKTGDSGTTSLLGGTRLSKANIRIDSYGTVDELNAWIGMLRDQPVNEARRALHVEHAATQTHLFLVPLRLNPVVGLCVELCKALSGCCADRRIGDVGLKVTLRLPRQQAVTL